MIPNGLADKRLITAINSALASIEETVGDSARVQAEDIDDFEAAIVALLEDEESDVYAAVVAIIAAELA